MAVKHVSLGEALAEAARETAVDGRDLLARHERRAWLVAAISLAVMAGELAGGAWLNSLALQSDGLHAASHAGVLLITALAYVLARRPAAGGRSAARILDMAALASGVLLGLVGVAIAVEAVERLITPEPVRFGEAAALTALGLVVSVVSAVILRGDHERAHVHDHAHHDAGQDLNLWAAYLHMVSDVVTSVLALAALLLGAFTGWSRLDGAVGLLNAGVVALFSGRLLWSAARALSRQA